jgi:hypothetical protein
LPPEVVVSMCSCRDRKPMPRSFRSFTVGTRFSQVAVEPGYVEVGKLTEQLDEALDVLSMTHPASGREPGRPPRSGAEQ